MSDTGTQAPPRQSEFQGTQPAPTPEELRQQQAALNPQGAPQPTQQQGLTQAELEAERLRIRTEEAARLREPLNDLNRISAELAELRAEREAERAEAQRLLDEATAAAETERQSKMTLTQRLEHHSAETDARFRAIEQERQVEQALFQREREFAAQNEYRTQALAANAEQIIPQLRDLVVQGTQEEVDQSIADLIARSNAVFADVQQAQQQQWQGQRGVQPTGMAASGPLENMPDQTREFSAAEIAAMSNSEYAKHRNRLIQGASRYMNGQRR